MKKPNSQRILLLFTIVSFTDLLLLLLPLDSHSLRYFTKPLLVPLLIYYDYVSRNSTILLGSSFRLALLFAWLGDVLLMFPSAFLFGLLAFLIMQAMYTRIFWKDCVEPRKGFIFQRPWIIVFFVAIHLSIMYLVWDHLGAMQIPVSIYSVVIVGMVLSAINRVGVVENAILVAIGAILFMISDSLIAVSKFGLAFCYSSFWVMLTYILAQYLILAGRRSLNE